MDIVSSLSVPTIASYRGHLRSIPTHPSTQAFDLLVISRGRATLQLQRTHRVALGYRQALAHQTVYPLSLLTCEGWVIARGLDVVISLAYLHLFERFAY